MFRIHTNVLMPSLGEEGFHHLVTRFQRNKNSLQLHNIHYYGTDRAESWSFPYAARSALNAGSDRRELGSELSNLIASIDLLSYDNCVLIKLNVVEGNPRY